MVIGGRFRIEAELAAGGMGAVFRATDLRSGQEVALKRLRDATSSRDVALFEREYQTLASIQHPRIVEAFDYGVDAHGPYYTMEIVHGTDLHALSPVPARDACRHIRDVASCLALLHTRRLLHRDITPRNVRVLDDGTCKLLDFGALTSFGIPDRVVGTPPFMPPEALQAGATLDQRADIFSLGALLYWTLTRKHAFPARRIESLPDLWRQHPITPRTWVADVTIEIEALVMRMLNIDPMARPATMAEVVERLNAAAGLEPEPEHARHALAQSYLVHAEFVGRDDELAELQHKLTKLEAGHGSATLISGTSGVGRTRVLEELRIYGQLQGFNTLHLDGDDCRSDDHAAVAIIRHLLATSAAARAQAQAFAVQLTQLGAGVAEYVTPTNTNTVTARSSTPANTSIAYAPIAGRVPLPECVVTLTRAASTETPLLMTIDNLDEVDDDVSLATLTSLTRLTSQAPLCMMLTARTDGPRRNSILWQLLREQCQALTIGPLSAEHTTLLARSMFGDAANLVRFSRWLHDLSGGLPLHFIELARRLHESGVIVHDGSLWLLPSERPDQIQDDAFSDLLTARLRTLSAPARALAEALAVQRTSLTRMLCFELAAREGAEPRLLLDELVQKEVLTPTLYGYHFCHVSLRDELTESMSDARRKLLHQRCAEQALSSAPHRDRRRALIEAGWHLLQAGDESAGAERIAEAAVDTVAVRFALADVPDYAPALETALQVYERQGRTLYERLPLMATLAQAGYYGDRDWGERYGASALEAVQQASGLTLARKLRPYVGRTIGVLSGLLIAFLRFTFARKRGPTYSFRDVLVQLFGVVTTLTGAASIALDVERAERIAATLEPFLGLPDRLTPVGIAQFCAGLKEIGRDNQAAAIAGWDRLLSRLRNPRFYPALPDEARVLYLGGVLFALGALSVFRDGNRALKAADELDALGLKLYRMIASAIRAQYYTHRGQLEDARRCRRQVDDHAVQVGSAWQAELWEPSSLILVHTTMGDVAEMRSVADRLHALAKDVPSLQRYAEFAELAFRLTREDDSRKYVPGSARSINVNRWVDEAVALHQAQAPRSLVGWGAMAGYCARALNMLGRHGDAKALCEKTLNQLSAADRPFVAMFLNLEIELSVADAYTGNGTAAAARLHELMTLHQDSDNPLTRGRIHEALARVSAIEQRWPGFREHMAQARAWYERTGSAALIARIEGLRALDPIESMRSMRAPAASTLKIQPVKADSDASSEDGSTQDAAAQDATSQAVTAALDK